ncbi:hypothetical protein OTK59_18790 [Vibrio natriegens]|uniref:hypothetical protein n=1 Tax=Vibrio natriegens TaxID=691 RepID=UPI002283C09A|nr:hypothetical protein [Vibrio natriegens]MCY9878608.1 hypothetical protein [Vibrio natriegens]
MYKEGKAINKLTSYVSDQALQRKKYSPSPRYLTDNRFTVKDVIEQNKVVRSTPAEYLKPIELPSIFNQQSLMDSKKVMQARILKDVKDAGKSLWPGDFIIKPRYCEPLLNFIRGKVAYNPNVSVLEKLNDMEEDAKFNKRESSIRKIHKIRYEYSNLVDGLSFGNHRRLTWGYIQREWSKLDDDIQKQFIELQGSKWIVGQHNFNLDRSQSQNINRASEGEKGEDWRQRGVHKTLRTKLPYKMNQHYTVGTGTKQAPGPERIFTKNAVLINGEKAVHAYYSATHGDNSHNGKNNITRIISEQNIGDMRVVAPWDPYLSQKDGKEFS